MLLGFLEILESKGLRELRESLADLARTAKKAILVLQENKD